MPVTLRDPLKTSDPPLLMCERTLAKRWGISVRTLQRWRASCYGPPHILLGTSVRYRLDDVLACQSARKADPVSAPKFDPPVRCRDQGLTRRN